MKTIKILFLLMGLSVSSMGFGAAAESNFELHKAAQAGELAKVLLRQGADVNKADKYGRIPLIIASYRGHLNVVKELLKAKANVNQAARTGNRETPLYGASYNGHLDVVKELLKAKANVNQADKMEQLLFI